MDTIDLHVHSNCSDGTLTPAELVAYALQKGLRAIALTDHDTVSGLEEAFAAAADTPLEVIAGIEFSTEYLHRGIHIVGLDIPDSSPAFAEQLSLFQNSRSRRNEKMMQKMQEDGVDISPALLWEKFGDSVITRAHFARYLADCGYAADVADAFTRFVNKGARYYVPREKITPAQAVRLIYRCGGIPVLAHPMQYHLSAQELDDLIVSLKEEGLIGMEVYYSTHTPGDERFLSEAAKRHQLLPSGGSDFHGSNKPAIDLGVGKGNLAVPYQLLSDLRSLRRTL